MAVEMSKSKTVKLIPKDFTPLRVSTTTVIAPFDKNINIVDVAKYLELDDVIIGIKLVYAGGASSIIRGVAKMTKKKKDFYNQVTFTIRLPLSGSDSILASCKIFHNGTLHVTGTRCLEEATNACNLLLERLCRFKGMKMIALKTATNQENSDVSVDDAEEEGIGNFLCSFDNLLLSTTGETIGWINEKFIYVKSEYVVPSKIDIGSESFPVFVSAKWTNGKKALYSMNGDLIGHRQIQFTGELPKKHFEVKFGYVYSGNKIVGNEEINLKEGTLQLLQQQDIQRKYLLSKGYIVRVFDAFGAGRAVDKETFVPNFTPESFQVHMINTFFQAPFPLCRKKLHLTFKKYGFISRFDPGSHAAVNLRFHYNESTKDNQEKNGKCIYREESLPCQCKDISVSCFNLGTIIITGLATIEQGALVYNFLKRFFTENRDDIMDKDVMKLYDDAGAGEPFASESGVVKSSSGNGIFYPTLVV